ncbi:hypothetical protein PV08_12032 [Exophiala spinifera]|uniref:Uncharacterized protein n=1 Tax=Exophiala spinifera TaxID=91928 RepID=A0A0D2ASP8_9EURO|nr:uncharacterized protein PV08_12032 [Exophiala spinifera]KIW09748.1 hypothetical protein PV08_12032 [Exophiala spinifera]
MVTTLIRLGVGFFSLISLAMAAFNGAIAHFAIVLQNRARTDLVNVPHDRFDQIFEHLMSRVIVLSIILCVTSAVGAFSGGIFAVYQPLSLLWGLLIGQIVVFIANAILAGNVHGYKTSFTWFGKNDKYPYYDLIYYGSIAQMGWALLQVPCLVLCCCCRARPRESQAEQPGEA